MQRDENNVHCVATTIYRAGSCYAHSRISIVRRSYEGSAAQNSFVSGTCSCCLGPAAFFFSPVNNKGQSSRRRRSILEYKVQSTKKQRVRVRVSRWRKQVYTFHRKDFKGGGRSQGCVLVNPILLLLRPCPEISNAHVVQPISLSASLLLRKPASLSLFLRNRSLSLIYT